MQLYFVKATFTNNVYKLSDFFLSNEYKLTATKMLDINFRPDDGLTSFITKNITLPDGSSIRSHTHIIVPDFEKIYRIVSVDYINIDQAMVTLDEDPLIGNYQELKETNMIIHRTNDNDYFRGVNDIADLTLKETVDTTVVVHPHKTGKWMLIFMQININKARYGLKFKNVSPVSGYYSYEQYVDIATLVAKYPEVTTTTPNLYDYYQKIVRVGAGIGTLYQCVYNGDGSNTKLLWIKKNSVGQAEGDIYFDIGISTSTKLNSSDIRNVIVALPFGFNYKAVATDGNTLRLLEADSFVAPLSAGEIIDIKIIDDIMLPVDSVTYDFWNGSDPRELFKTVTSSRGIATRIYISDVTPTPIGLDSLYLFFDFEKEIDLTINPFFTPTNPLYAEPFRKYDLYIHGKQFSVPYYLMGDVKMMIVFNSGVINYIIYYGDKRYILASGSFTHSMKWQVDGLDSFYNQNPTYKEQFFTKMSIDAMKGIMGGAVAGSVVPGLGTLAGAGLGALSSGVDAGISMLNLHYQEKGMKLKPDQIFGENSELGLQFLNIFGCYWVVRTSENADLMKIEYDLRGFPTTIYAKISDLTGASGTFGTALVVYGEIKSVIKNEYVTGYINQKLKEGVVII